jgi:hypothetical protein
VAASPSHPARRAPARSVSQRGLRRQRWLALHWPLSKKRRLLPRIGCSAKLRLFRHVACPFALTACTRRAGAQLQAPRAREGRLLPSPRPSSSSLVVQNTDCSEAARLARSSSWPGPLRRRLRPWLLRRASPSRSRGAHHLPSPQARRTPATRRARLQKGKRHPVARAQGQAPATSAAPFAARGGRLARPRSRKKRTLLVATRRTGALVCGAALSAAADSPDHPYSLKVVGAKPRAGVATRAERVRGAVTAARTRSAPLARTSPAQRAHTRRRRRGATLAQSAIEDGKRRDTTASKQRRAGGGAVKPAMPDANEVKPVRGGDDNVPYV